MGSMRSGANYIQRSGYVAIANRNQNGDGGELGAIRDFTVSPKNAHKFFPIHTELH